MPPHEDDDPTDVEILEMAEEQLINNLQVAKQKVLDAHPEGDPLQETEDTITVNGHLFRKPFVEKVMPLY